MTLLLPQRRGQEQLLLAYIIVEQRLHQRPEHEVEQPHGLGDFAHHQMAVRLQHRSEVVECPAYVLSGVDHVGSDDDIVVLGREALGQRGGVQIKGAVMHEVVVGEFLLRAVGEQQRYVGERVVDVRMGLEHWQQPGRSPARTAAHL